MLDQVEDLAGGPVHRGRSLHTVAAHADYLHRRGAFGLFVVKENCPARFAALDALDWPDANAGVRTVRTAERNRGRDEVREVRVQDLGPGQVPFPHAAQAVLVERTITGRGNGKSDSGGGSITNVPSGETARDVEQLETGRQLAQEQLQRQRQQLCGVPAHRRIGGRT